MNQTIKKSLMAVAAIAALALGGSALASAASNDGGSTGSTGTATQPPAGAPAGKPNGTPPDMASKTAINPNEKLLTGDTASKVKAAALANVKGTVDRVETDDGGVYEAHITKSDGTHVEVKVDKSFKVTAVNTMGDHGGGPGGY
jgi:hypothetical protein